PEHARRYQADGGTHQPLRRHPHHRRPGYARPDDAHRRGRRDHARRAREAGARPERSAYSTLPPARQSRLSTVPETRRVEGRAYRHSARLLFRAVHHSGQRNSTGRTQRRADRTDGGGDRGAEEGRRGDRGSRERSKRGHRRYAAEHSALEHVQRRGESKRAQCELLHRFQLRHEARLQRVACIARFDGAVPHADGTALVQHRKCRTRRDEVRPVATRHLGRDGPPGRQGEVRCRSREGRRPRRPARDRAGDAGRAARRGALSRREWRGNRGEAGLPDGDRPVRPRAQRAGARPSARIRRAGGALRRELHRRRVQRAAADRARVRVRAGHQAAGTAGAQVARDTNMRPTRAPNEIRIRPVTLGDAASVARIYNHYVADTIVTFEEEAVSSEEIVNRIFEVQSASLPWLVAERGQDILGYAYASMWKGRIGYRFAVEVTVYL